MSYILDCESFESTLTSLSKLFSCKKNNLVFYLNKYNLDRIYQNENPLESPDEYLYKKVVAKFGIPEKLSDVCWFHLTRTTLGNKFQDGILPLGDVLPKIWETLLEIFKKTKHYKKILKLKSNGVKDFQYNLKSPDSFFWGPYAMLIREVAWRSKEMGSVDYFQMPEIIEDICNGYKEYYGEAIFNIISNSLKPCIIKFISNKRLDNNCIKAAIYYVYIKLKGNTMSMYSNTCFDGEGSAINSDNILKIEFVKYP